MNLNILGQKPQREVLVSFNFLLLLELNSVLPIYFAQTSLQEKILISGTLNPNLLEDELNILVEPQILFCQGVSIPLSEFDANGVYSAKFNLNEILLTKSVEMTQKFESFFKWILSHVFTNLPSEWDKSLPTVIESLHSLGDPITFEDEDSYKRVTTVDLTVPFITKISNLKFKKGTMILRLKLKYMTNKNTTLN